MDVCYKWEKQMQAQLEVEWTHLVAIVVPKRGRNMVSPIGRCLLEPYWAIFKCKMYNASMTIKFSNLAFEFHS